ncbi:hypothetical protein DL762_004740 [Monosporascus cannonballus]|uniref:Reverse transcriptase domain-containing protein n=1 Tax=Monosporascus cannonballus TaxID=155416 RepID=A0ABY0H7E2_9PEZI|nr:hypothetical protein DL762_004740 [Monosporascus cannonballus]
MPPQGHAFISIKRSTLAVDWSWQQAAPGRKRLWAKTNVPTLRQTVQNHLPRLEEAAELRDRKSIDKFVASIVNALNAGVDASTLWSNPPPRSISGFDQECKGMCAEVQQLRRRWQQTGEDEDYEAYRQARNGKGRLIQKVLRSTHRQRVEDAATSQSGLWNLVKWAKNRHNTTSACTPALNARTSYTEDRESSAQGSPEQSSGLCKLHDACLQLGYCPAHFKESITVVLRNQGKGDYSQPKAYRPIALLNTLGKVMGAISQTGLPISPTLTGSSQAVPGSRKLTSTEHATHPLLQRIHQAWSQGEAASLLLLDVSDAYHSVSRERLLHNLRKRRNTDLIEACKAEKTEAVGYTDDVSILVVGPTAQHNCKTLKGMHEKAGEWAKKHGSLFAPATYEQVHFTRDPKRTAHALRLMHATIQASPSCRYLGIQMDTRLRWDHHREKVEARGTERLSALSAGVL